MHDGLRYFLKTNETQFPALERVLREKTSVKDVIEACGIPHPEIDLILCEGASVDLAYCLDADTAVDVYPVGAAPELFPAQRLQKRHIERFVADGHLGKLTRDLRLLGIDVAYSSQASDAQLLARAIAEDRALLTRDRRLLMHAVVRHGYCPHSDFPEEQTAEVLRRFDLFDDLRPFSRCLRCNAPLDAVGKSEVIDALEPLTRRYYEDFRRCCACGQIYWRGSHFAKLQARIERTIAQQGNQKSAIKNQK